MSMLDDPPMVIIINGSYDGEDELPSLYAYRHLCPPCDDDAFSNEPYIHAPSLRDLLDYWVNKLDSAQTVHVVISQMQELVNEIDTIKEHEMNEALNGLEGLPEKVRHLRLVVDNEKKD